MLYLSRHILANKSDYYRLLLDVTRERAWEPWILFMLETVTETSHWTSAKIEAIRNLDSATAGHVKGLLPRIYSRELIDVIFEQPYCRIANLVERGIAKRQTASRYLHELSAAGVLTELTAGREKLFVQPRLMHLLTEDSNDFARFDDCPRPIAPPPHHEDPRNSRRIPSSYASGTRKGTARLSVIPAPRSRTGLRTWPARIAPAAP